MAKKATKRELLRKSRAGARNILLSKSKKKSYLRPDEYKLPETVESESASEE